MKIKYKDKIYEVDELMVIMPHCVSPQRVRADEVQVVADEIVVTGQRFVPIESQQTAEAVLSATVTEVRKVLAFEGVLSFSVEKSLEDLLTKLQTNQEL